MNGGEEKEVMIIGEKKKNESKKEKEEIQIQLDQIKYPLMIKYKYSNKEILDYLGQIENSISFDKNNFVNIIDDIMDIKMKNLEINKRENLDKIIPKNNPLLSFKGNK